MNATFAKHHYWFRRIALLATLLVVSNTLAQSTLFQLETGSFTPANGSLVPLSGSFEWGPEMVIYSPHIGEDIVERYMIGLYFSAENTSFHLNTAPGNLCPSQVTPGGLGGLQWSFCAVVDAFDSSGVI